LPSAEQFADILGNIESSGARCAYDAAGLVKLAAHQRGESNPCFFTSTFAETGSRLPTVSERDCAALTLLKNPLSSATANRMTMTDDTTKREYRDRDRINVHEDYELRYWTKELGVAPEKLKQTVAKVGVMAVDVRKALRH
jgi:hypothetical protein